MPAKPACPHCQSPFVQRDQLTPGRYRCRSCNRAFIAADSPKTGHQKRKSH